MASKIFNTILQRKINMFVNTFSDDSESIFKNEINKLIHPGEYGIYREACLKELLTCIMDKDVGVSDGFIITSEDKVSTQCDVLIYTSKVMPIIDNNTAKFFPVESVLGIGEVKSNLNKTKFKEALLKMATNKKLFDQRKGVYTGKYSHFNEYKYPLSFLVCKRLDFDIANINFEEIYGEIPREYWHNIILSLEDGCIAYELDFKELPPKMLERFREAGGNLESDKVIWECAIHKVDETYNCNIVYIKAREDDVYKHINTCLTLIRNMVGYVVQYEFDVVHYLGNGVKGIFRDE